MPDLNEARKRTKDKVNILYDEYKVPENVKNIGNGKSYALLTYGCQMNVHDSENIAGIMEDMGYTRIENYEKANIVILNTCAIRENAHNKVIGILGRIKHLKETNKDLITVVCGCMAQEESIAKMIRDKYPWIDIVLGTHNFYELPVYISKVLEDNKQEICVYSIEGDVIEDIPTKRDSKVKAWVNIQYGCDKFCSYCIVPYTRGRERSRKPEDILNEVKELAEEGYKEITLLGQNVNSYNGGEGYKFANLLNDVCKIDGIERIRFISPHPKDFTDDVIEAIANNSKIARVIHLPLQSGSSEVLKKMNRKYTKEQYLALVDKMKTRIPDIVLSTDIIVGFPDETEEDFEDTLDVVRKVNYEQVYMFIYSRREGTVADKMENQIPEEIKHQRFDRLKELFDSRVSENNQKYIGTTQRILVDGYSKNDKETLTGRTDTNKVVNFKGNEELIGKMIDIKITEEHKWYLAGEIQK